MVLLPRPLERKLGLDRLLSTVAYGLIVAPPELIGNYKNHHRGLQTYCGLRAYCGTVTPSTRSGRNGSQGSHSGPVEATHFSKHVNLRKNKNLN